jgi:CDP-glucose 4,6-dehydratase
LDIAFKKDFVKAIIVVTTDKVYRNDNSGRAFVESDPLEGKDPYSASKVGTESVVAAWQQIAKVSGGPKVISVRAGNVIGGGDLAENRIIPDLIRGVMTGKPVEIRNPDSTRPWQHVLDPLSGYLSTLEFCLSNATPSNFNFGPVERSIRVSQIVQTAKYFFPSVNANFSHENNVLYESLTLELDSSLSLHNLNWRPLFDQQKSVDMTFGWWKKAIDTKAKVSDLCRDDISKGFGRDIAVI